MCGGCGCGCGQLRLSLTVALVHPPELQVPVALPGMVEVVGIGDLGEEGAGILGQGVKEHSIGYETDDLIEGERDVSSSTLYTTARLEMGGTLQLMLT